MGRNVDLKTDAVDNDVYEETLADIERVLGADEKGIYYSACFSNGFTSHVLARVLSHAPVWLVRGVR